MRVSQSQEVSMATLHPEDGTKDVISISLNSLKQQACSCSWWRWKPAMELESTFMVVTLLLLSVSSAACHRVPSTSYISSDINDCHTLLNFKEGFDDLSGTLDAWNSSSISGCCDWLGVTCNSAGRVTALGLGAGEMNLVNNKNRDEDSTTRFLTRLPDLVSLNLSNVDLAGSVPAPILSLTSLEFLSLFQCNLSGSLPSFASLSRLRYLDLGYNNRVSEWTLESAGICSLGQLEFLSATGNYEEGEGQLSGPIPACLATALNHLDLATNKLSGETAELSRLGNLTHLDLSINNVDGPLSHFCSLLRLRFLNVYQSVDATSLPDCIGNNLTELEYLDIGDNDLIGRIPASLGRLSRLQSLHMDWNLFTGAIPASLANLTQLQVLTIDNNHGARSTLSGPIPSFLADLHGLRTLALGNLGLSGSIPPGLGGLHGLEYMELATMPGLSGIIPEQLGNLSSLLFLAISSTGITGNIPQQLGNLSRLQQLDLSANSLTGSVPDALGRDLRSLELLYLHDNRLSGGVPAAVVSRLHSLEFLDLSGNALTGSIPSSIGLSRLAMLDLSRNSLTGSFPVSLCNIESVRIGDNLLHDLSPDSTPPSVTRLFSLLLSSNKLSGELPYWLSRQSTIVELDLSANNISGPIPAWLTGHSPLTRSLYSLNLSHNRLSSELPSIPPVAMLDLHANQLTGPIRLHTTAQSVLYIDISENLFSGIASDAVSELPMISYLSMASNGLAGAIPSFLFGEPFANLVALDLSHNRFSGGIPSSLPYLLELVLAHNNLSGHLPSSFSDYMRRLDVSNNGFSGSIPLQIGSIQSMEILDLSQNQLTGHIPSEFLNLTFLSSFNVSHNHLSGPIPQGDALSKFDRSSFGNNGALCGYPLDPC